MSTELLRFLTEASVTLCAALLIVLALRSPLKRIFGAGMAYAYWCAVPATMAAQWLPAGQGIGMAESVGFWSLGVGETSQLRATVTASADAAMWPIAIWMLGAIACAAWMISSQRRFRMSFGALTDIGEGCRRAQSTSGLPALVGLWRPVIVLPSDFEHRFDPAQRALMLAHERTHLHRGDLWINALVAALRCLFWFNPLLHYAAACFRHDQELSCDASVIAQHPRARAAYARAMFTTQLAAQATPLGCHWGHTHPLQERIQMLKRNNNTPLRRIVGIALVTALVGGVGTVAWAAQPREAIAAVAVPGTVVMELLAKTSELEQRFTKIEPLGKEFSISTGSKGALWLIEGVVTVGEDKALYPASTPDTVWLAMRLHKNGKLLATPKVAVKSGGIARVKQGVKSDSAPDLDLQIKLTATKAVDTSVRSVASR